MVNNTELFQRFIKNECSPAEIDALLKSFAEAENEIALRRMILMHLEAQVTVTDADMPDLVQKEKNIYSALKPQLNNGKTKLLWKRIAVAASLILVSGLSVYNWYAKENLQQTAQNKNVDVPAGGNKATLTLANGQAISLTTAKNGIIANQGNISITKTTNGKLVYNSLLTGNNAPDGYNLMTTPRGGQYQLTLSDGTRVWLNAASSLKYPTQFTGKERKVELTGEAYFEVAHLKAVPFKVVSAQQVVEVLGTHFDINTYPDEPAIKTTLFQGSVKVSSTGKNILLRPGQQSTFFGGNIAVKNIDTDDVIAWKNGMFQFSDESLESIMRKVSRWYNVDIVYDNDDVKKLLFTGVISNNGNISSVLHLLERTKQIHFKIDGSKVILSK